MPIEIDVGSALWAVTFTENGDYLLSGDNKDVRVWRVEDRKQVANMEAKIVNCLAVSKNGLWIAAGTYWGCSMFVWDANTYEQILTHKGPGPITGVDFSPDSTRLVSASVNPDYTATIWDLATGEQAHTLRHNNWVRAVKYSAQGDRIATATYQGSVRLWDSDNGHLLVDIPVKVTPYYYRGLLWFNAHLFVISDSKIKEFDASTGSAVSEWPVANTDGFSCIAVPKHGEFIAYSTKRTVTFWDTSTHSQLGLVQHSQDIRSIAFSPDDRFLAIGGGSGSISIKSLSRITVSVVFFLGFDVSERIARLHHTF